MGRFWVLYGGKSAHLAPCPKRGHRDSDYVRKERHGRRRHILPSKVVDRNYEAIDRGRADQDSMGMFGPTSKERSRLALLTVGAGPHSVS